VTTDLTIGVNDVNKFFPDTPADYLVVIDPPQRFTPERLHTIRRSSPRKFFTHYYNEWRPLVQNLQGLNMSAGYDFQQLDKPGITLHSNNSPFVAAVLAYKMGARRIIMHGADFNTHPNFRESDVATALGHFNTLFKELRNRGVALNVGSSYSQLAKVLPII
jgi:hypothetical protein